MAETAEHQRARLAYEASLGRWISSSACWRLDAAWEANDGPIAKMNERLRLAAYALVAQIVLWTAAIASTL